MDHNDVTVAAVMTAPRYECVAARNQIERALQGIGVPLLVSGGVYYHQCMESMLESLLDESVQYALTIDFDSMFTAAHAQRLLNIIVQESQIDALAAIQPMRGKGRVLASLDQETAVQWQGAPIQVNTAHFGLTVLDMAKVRATPKPWFCAAPDERGGWGDSCIDADVSFWQTWTAAGHSIYLDPGTRLGHMEELITYFDEEMTLRHAYLRDWEKLSETTVDQ